MVTEGQRKFGIGVLVGVLLTLACVGALLLIAIMRAPSIEDVLKDDVQKQSAEEQARLGVDCKGVDADLKRYLNSQAVERLSSPDKPLAEWKQSLTQSVVEQTATVTTLVRVCAPIYTRGGKGKLNGLDHLRFATPEVYVDLIQIDSVLKYQRLDQCNDPCLEKTRSIVRHALSNLKKRVSGQSAQSNPSLQSGLAASGRPLS